MQIRPFLPDDAPTLRAVFHSSVHQLACQHYTTHAVASLDPSGIRRLAMVRALTRQPPMGGRGGRLHCIEGFANLQPSGHIDPFFVADEHAGHGVGRALMAQIHSAAQQARNAWPGCGRCEPERRTVFQPQRLCSRGAPAGGAARSGAGECTHGQQAAFCFLIDSC